MRKKIIVTQGMDLFPDQIERLKTLGEVKIYNDLANTPEEWLDRCKGFDIICTGKFGLKQKVYELKNVFISLPFVGIGWLDKEKLEKKNIKVAYSPGCNKDAVSEWIIGMMINLLRELPRYINIKNLPGHTLPGRTLGLTNKKVCILGAGNIGSRVGKICESFGMKVNFFLRGYDLSQSIKDADIVINCLSQNPTTLNLLDDKFFSTLKNNSHFISVTSPKIYDTEALLNSLGKNIAGAAIDAADIQVGDTNNPFYKKLLQYDRVLTTPHIAYNTDVTARVGNDMMIDNIKAYLEGKPINLL